MKSKEPVRLREKKLKNGNKSLYLDIYDGGFRRYEFLHLYLVDERTREDRERNNETMRVAQAIKSRMVMDINARNNGVERRVDVPFIQLMEKVLISDCTDIPAYNVATYNAVCAYEPNKAIKCRAINASWLEGLDRFMQKQGLATNTRVTYFQRIKKVLNYAYDNGIIHSKPHNQAKLPNYKESERAYLTMDEVRLFATKSDDVIARAFLFSCLTGMRLSDVRQLDWEMCDGTRITFEQKKTRGLVYLDINPQALQLMGEPKNQGIVFKLPTTPYINRKLKTYAKELGIRKHISFHVARHTFATMMLTLGADIYTVSKLLGHSDISITQIYAKVIDQKRREAVLRIPSLLSEQT